MRFLNQVAIVTGGASGIGLATVLRLAQEGAHVVIADLDTKRNDSVLQKIKLAGLPEALACVCDVSSSEQVKTTVAKTQDRFGRFDILVNNAGFMLFKAIVDSTTEDWLRILSVDLLGAFHFTKEAFLHMQPGGAIVNVSSIHALETTPLVSSYAAAKSALLSFTRSSSLEAQARGIRVNAVLPGAIDTPMLWNNPNIKSGLEHIETSRVGTPEDIAAVIAFLASKDAKFVQGAFVRADGGRLDLL
jgi:meso-butanediol dehydrogenase/(S,S)-butanediol dehydrogenase/diacetyl reductase